ncbi:uncharacterized protein LOC113317958 [Papaver somniferum]|uniref:uncharacterized protein LOC113317958 n=1 Tax=Papaver somniferum TaxID=3469 RepID=UPI000E700836|nr:uncharacterized protein LOC113317958 [Papaver somniferum]XP_026421851.1 uncharacterized protein LOC113317958 [Papaver somniferum]XP_026421852.1 uncharacterized protein LOC113317958 [Papaver somniferum]XP_026421854.1 uncharacterized protein LOC113317958 [Papaver somniferum]XP_026421855.1 uncharacterized protein LOC113317958 [Papaver somniferum]XP_026421856.1 uncharacterized protein LOC113317958 [Papaver somniferum]XP_026421857.1 uncharacterized protein LOC113317958 [Papaver somniferum]
MVEEEEEYEYKEEVEPENTVATEEGEGEYKETANDKENDIAANENAKRDEVVQGEEKRKRVPRGPTRMASLGITEDKTKKPDKATVIFNSKDQPIGDPSVQLASVLGVLVRRNSPLTFKDWRVIPKEAKNNVWKIFQMRFIVNDFYKDYYYGKMGCYLKEARSRKVGKILVIDELEEEEREKRIKELKPQNMSDNEWEDFVETVCSEEFRAKRLKMQEIRQKHTTPHTISREGYARLEEKMQKERKTTEEIDRVELWITGHKQKEGKEPNPGVIEAFLRTQENYYFFVYVFE